MQTGAPYQNKQDDGNDNISFPWPHNYCTSFLFFLRLAAMLEKFIKKEVGKQKPTRILSAVRIRKKIFSIASPTKRSKSISNAQNSAAKTPITARIANETIPVFVIILSKLLKLMIGKI